MPFDTRHPTANSEILVFKTSVRKARQVRRMARLLDPFGRWNFDLGDRDRILRVEADHAAAPRICALLTTRGFRCEELPD